MRATKVLTKIKKSNSIKNNNQKYEMLRDILTK